jgi:hypothetical protein
VAEVDVVGRVAVLAAAAAAARREALAGGEATGVLGCRAVSGRALLGSPQAALIMETRNPTSAAEAVAAALELVQQT